MPDELARLAAELARLAHDPELPDWLARALSWTAADLLAEATRRRATRLALPPAANDNHHHGRPAA